MIRRPPRSTLFPTRRSSDLLEAGADDYVAKPFDENELLARAGKLIRARAQEREIIQLQKEKIDRKSTSLNSSHGYISYAVFCLKKKKNRLNITNSANVEELR